MSDETILIQKMQMRLECLKLANIATGHNGTQAVLDAADRMAEFIIRGSIARPEEQKPHQ